MSGPNGDPNIPIDEGIINDEDEFDDEGNAPMSFNWRSLFKSSISLTE